MQSESTKHSGLHDGGTPIYPIRQEHTACAYIARHTLFGPQGDGSQTLLLGGITEIQIS